MKIKKLTIIGILAAVICVTAPLSLPLGAIPVSLATFSIYFISCTTGKKYAVAAVIIYILIGTAGLPVFSYFTGGFQKIAGLTGGYIIGYIPCAFIIAALTDKFESKKYIYPVSMICGTAVCYITGTLWYMLQAKCSFLTAVTACIIPFIIGDAVKIIAASCIGTTLRKRLKQFI